MTQKWNLQDIQPARSKRRRPTQATTERQDDTHAESHDNQAEDVPIQNGRKKKRGFTIYITLAVVVFVLAVIAISYVMRGAEVTVTPKTHTSTINADILATPEPQENTLVYEILTLETEGERQVKASGTEQVESLAEGVITIYNEQSSDPVRLITNTRFAAPDGKIFRIKEPAIVPGYSTENGEIVPGSITADVFADEVGDDYNLQPSSFTIPGFEGEPEYETVYAESAEDFTGGFNGERFIIAEEELETGRQALRTELRNTLLERVESEKPAGFALFMDTLSFTYESQPAVSYGEDLATLKEKAVLRVPVFEQQEFAAYVAEATVPNYDEAQVRIDDYSKLQMQYITNDDSASDISQHDELALKLTGKPTLVWEYDTELLKAELASQKKSDIDSVLENFASITEAKAVVRPFWRTSFPVQIEEIEVFEEY